MGLSQRHGVAGGGFLDVLCKLCLGVSATTEGSRRPETGAVALNLSQRITASPGERARSKTYASHFYFFLL
jgi:hypothetical protein